MSRTGSRRWLLFVLMFSGCSALRLATPLRPTPEDWSTLGGSVTRTGTRATSFAPPLALEWETDIAAGTGPGSPVTVDSAIVLGTLRGELYVIHCRTGKRLGSTVVGDAIGGSPLVSGNTVIVAMSNPVESLLAFDLALGRPVWTKGYGDMEVTPLLYGRRLYSGNIYGTFFCIDPQNGEQLWNYAIPGNVAMKGIRSSPAAAGTMVIFGADDGTLYGMDTALHKPRWTVPTGSPIVASVAIDSGMAVVGTLAGMVYAVDCETGIVRWTHTAGASVYAGAVLTQSTALISTIGGMVMRLRMADGSTLWTRDIRGPVSGAAVATGEYIYLGTLDKRFICLSLASGEVLWSTMLEGRVKSAPAVACGRLLVTTDDRSLLSFIRRTP